MPNACRGHCMPQAAHCAQQAGHCTHEQEQHRGRIVTKRNNGRLDEKNSSSTEAMSPMAAKFRGLGPVQ